jgi:hypothetical protein
MHTDQREPRARVKQASDTALCHFCDSQPRASSGELGLDFSHFLCDTRRIRGLNTRTLTKLSAVHFVFVLPQPGSVQFEPCCNADIRCTDVDSGLDMEDAISYRLQQKGGSRVVTRRGCTVQNRTQHLNLLAD